MTGFYSAPLSAIGRPRLYQLTGPSVLLPDTKRHVSLARTLPYAEECSLFGAGMLRGTLTAQGTAVRDRVVAVEAYGLVPFGAAYSERGDGSWVLYPLPRQRKYLVIASDREVRFNAVCADGLTAVPWED